MVAVGGDRTTLPDSAGSSPARVRSRVDLPAPFTPTSPITSPGATTRSRSVNSIRSAWPAARPLATSVAVINGGSYLPAQPVHVTRVAVEVFGERHRRVPGQVGDVRGDQV